MNVNSITKVGSFQIAWIEQTKKWEVHTEPISRIPRIAFHALKHIIPGAIGLLIAYDSNSFLSNWNWTPLTLAPCLISVGILATLVTACIQEYIWPMVSTSQEHVLFQQLEKALLSSTPEKEESLLHYLLDPNLPNQSPRWQKECINLLHKKIAQTSSASTKELISDFLIHQDAAKLDIEAQKSLFNNLRITFQDSLTTKETRIKIIIFFMQQAALTFILKQNPTKLTDSEQTFFFSVLEAVLEDPQTEQSIKENIVAFLLKIDPNKLASAIQSNFFSALESALDSPQTRKSIITFILKQDQKRLTARVQLSFSSLLRIALEDPQTEQPMKEDIVAFLLELDPNKLGIKVRNNLSSLLRIAFRDPQIDHKTKEKITAFFLKHPQKNTGAFYCES